MHPIKRKIESVFGFFRQEEPPEAIFLFNRDRVDRNFLYVTGLENGVFENCGVLFEPSGRMCIFTSGLEEEAVRSAGVNAEIVVYRNERERNESLTKVLSNYRTIGLCYGGISHWFYLFLAERLGDVEWVDATSALKTARMIKSDDEVAIIRHACEITSRVADEVPGILREGMTELELAAEIDYMLRRRGAHGSAFRTIAAFSSNTSMPHYAGGDVRLKSGDAILVDFGAEYRGYASDITQTYLTGAPEPALLALYETVRGAEKTAISLIRDGAGVEAVENEVKRLTESREEYRGRFIHSLGHSLGLEVHDDGYPSAAFDTRFRENMVLTVEPGIYLPGVFGVRLEDDIVVKKDGCEVLTTADKELRTYEIV